MKGQIFFDLPLILNLFCKVCCVTENNNSINEGWDLCYGI